MFHLKSVLFVRTFVFSIFRSRTVSYKDITKPWITHEIKSFMRNRQNYLKLYRLRRVTRATYNQYRNFVNKKIIKSNENVNISTFLVKSFALVSILQVSVYLLSGSPTHCLYPLTIITQKAEVSSRRGIYYIGWYF